MAIIAGFGSSAYLIQSSFSDWSDSPVSTTITPRPVSHLPFPEVAICPPEGINSALKYDLMRIYNTTINEKLKKVLLSEVKKLFGEKVEQAYVGKIKSLVGSGNIRNLFSGFISFPEETEEGYLIELSGLEGTFESPLYGHNFSLEQFMMYRGKEIHYKLDLEDIKSSMEDNDTLRIVVESDTDFDDEVVFGRYDRYESFKEK